MLGQVIGAISGLAGSYIEGKVAVNKANATKNLKIATGEIDWDMEAIKASQSSWKDEYVLILYSIPLILCFTGETGRTIVENGFIALQQMPQWYQISLGGIVASSIGMRGISKFYGKKVGK